MIVEHKIKLSTDDTQLIKNIISDCIKYISVTEEKRAEVKSRAFRDVDSYVNSIAEQAFKLGFEAGKKEGQSGE